MGLTGTANGALWGAQARDWADIQEGQFRAAYEAVFDTLRSPPGTRVCDIGCGSGLAAQIAASRGLEVCGLDAAEALLAIARSRVPAGDFRLGDMEALPFADGSADLVTGFNAFQYAGSPAAALAEAKRIVRASGAIVVMTWGQPQGMEAATLVGALKPLLPPPPPGAPGPFALSDKAALETLARSAGLRPAEIHDVTSAWTYPDLHAALRGLGSSGVAARAIATSGEEAVRAAHHAALTPFRQSDGSYRIGVRFRWMLARPEVAEALTRPNDAGLGP